VPYLVNNSCSSDHQHIKLLLPSDEDMTVDWRPSAARRQTANGVLQSYQMPGRTEIEARSIQGEVKTSEESKCAL